MKADANTLLEIAQSALARLGDAGVKVWVKNTEEGVQVTLEGVEVDGESKKLRKRKP